MYDTHILTHGEDRLESRQSEVLLLRKTKIEVEGNRGCPDVQHVRKFVTKSNRWVHFILFFLCYVFAQTSDSHKLFEPHRN